MAIFNRKSDDEILADEEAALADEEAKQQQDEQSESIKARIAEVRAKKKALKVARFKRTGFGRAGAKVEAVVKSVGGSIMKKSAPNPNSPQQPRKNPMDMLFGGQQPQQLGNRNPFASEFSGQPRGMNRGFMADDMALQKPKKKQKLILF